MVQAALILTPIMTVIPAIILTAWAVWNTLNELTPEKPTPTRELQVGKTLAQYRMQKLGITGDWRNYTTQRLMAA
jgi:heme/copper-type cytochrome/quinol oxidase subunit 2